MVRRRQHEAGIKIGRNAKLKSGQIQSRRDGQYSVAFESAEVEMWPYVFGDLLDDAVGIIAGEFVTGEVVDLVVTKVLDLCVTRLVGEQGQEAGIAHMLEQMRLLEEARQKLEQERLVLEVEQQRLQQEAAAIVAEEIRLDLLREQKLLQAEDTWRARHGLALVYIEGDADDATSAELESSELESEHKHSTLIRAAEELANGDRLFACGRYRQALGRFESASSLCAQSLGPRHTGVAEMLARQGACLRVLGASHEAIVKYSEVGRWVGG